MSFFHKAQKILGGFPEKNQGQRLVVVNYTFFWEVILVGHCGGIIFVGSLHFITFSGKFRFFEHIDIPRTMVLLAVATVGYRDCTAFKRTNKLQRVLCRGERYIGKLYLAMQTNQCLGCLEIRGPHSVREVLLEFHNIYIYRYNIYSYI